MTVTAAGPSWTVSGLGLDFLVDSQTDANTIDAALTAAAGTDSFSAILAHYRGLSRGGHFGHISTLTSPPIQAAVIDDLDGGSAT